MADLGRDVDHVAPQLTGGQRIWRRLHDCRERVLPAPKLGTAWRPLASGQEAGDLIYDCLRQDAPAMIARLGAGELEAMLRQLAIEATGLRLLQNLRYVAGRTPPPWWDAGFLDQMTLHPGFFPATPEMLARFTQVMLRDLPLVDILGSWLPGERELEARGLPARRVPLMDLEPYYHEIPWSRVLRDRVVLVVHPQADLVRRQYSRRTELFPGREVLPPFELKTFAPVVSHGGTHSSFRDWFAALDAMTDAIGGHTFDVAIIGAGAYGFPLAAAVKRMGRQAVHLGGATQILFGIRGNRWDAMPFFQGLFNSAWVHPDSATKPPRWREMEDSGSYW
ncbi:MAG: hypothetical protein ACYC5V_00255 [Gemmatimonadaceae bacterium]